MKGSIIGLVALWAVSGFVAHSAFAGGEVGNGGNADEILFDSIANQIATYLATAPGIAAFPEVASARLQSVIEGTKVKVVVDDLLDPTDNNRTAVNQPSNLMIYVDSRQWDPIKTEAAIAVPLVFHEFLGLMGLEVGDYKISSRIQGVSIPILQAATLDTDNIYFYAAPGLKQPIALYQTSVSLDGSGLLLSGEVARPSRVSTDLVQFYVEEGQQLAAIEQSRQDAAVMLISFALKPGYDAKIQVRLSTADPWYDAAAQAGSPMNIWFYQDRFNLAAIYQLRTSDFGRPLTYHKSGWTLTGYPVGLEFSKDEVPTSFQFGYYPGNNPQGMLSVGGATVSVQGADTIAGGTNFTSVTANSIIPLKVEGTQTVLKFALLPYLYLDDAGEAFYGSLSDCTANYGGVSYPVWGGSFKDGELQVVLAKPVPVTVAGTPILLSQDAEQKVCAANGFTYVDPGNSTTDSLNFSGEKTFYDEDKGDFTTLGAGQAQVIKSLVCSPIPNAAPVSIAASAIIQN